MKRYRGEKSRAGRGWFAVSLAVAVLVGGSLGGAVGGEEPPAEESAAVVGEQLYDRHCAKCHGATGAGDGQLANWLDVPPPDLTLLRRENGGTFPFAGVLGKIDGTEEVAGHDSPDMPIWREVFRAQDRTASDEEISHKLRSLTTYVGRLQVAE